MGLESTNIAFKEWAVVCDELGAGNQVVLLRKGGILEQKKGFEIEHQQFLMYPNVEHQSREQLKPRFHEKLDKQDGPPSEMGFIRVRLFCKVSDIHKTSDPDKLRALEPLTCWTQALFDMRINYKPEKPNFVVIVRAYKLPKDVLVPYHPDYKGCHSWVPLKDEIYTEWATPVLDDAAFEAKRREALNVLGV